MDNLLDLIYGSSCRSIPTYVARIDGQWDLIDGDDAHEYHPVRCLRRPSPRSWAGRSALRRFHDRCEGVRSRGGSPLRHEYKPSESDGLEADDGAATPTSLGGSTPSTLWSFTGDGENEILFDGDFDPEPCSWRCDWNLEKAVEEDETTAAFSKDSGLDKEEYREGRCPARLGQRPPADPCWDVGSGHT